MKKNTISVLTQREQFQRLLWVHFAGGVDTFDLEDYRFEHAEDLRPASRATHDSFRASPDPGVEVELWTFIVVEDRPDTRYFASIVE